MGRMIGALAGITGAATIAGVAALAREFLNLGTALERNADSMQLSTEQLQNMQNAVTLAGGSADDMTNALKALTAASVQAKTVGGAQAEMYRKYGISIDDANGKLRTAADLMPEVLAKINSYTDGRQRAMVADQLGGKALAELAEDFRRSGKSYTDWMKEAQKYSLVLNPDLLRQYRQAVGALQVSFTELGTAVSGVLAEALDPLIHDFADWIHTHQPQIVAAIQQIVDWFKKWYEAGGPQKLLDALSKIGDALLFVVDNAKTIAEIFAVAWGVKAVLGVVALINQVRLLNVALGGGALGFLGKLGVFGAAATGAYDVGRDVVKGPPTAKGEWAPWLNPTWGIHKLYNWATGGGGAAAPAAPAGTPGRQGAAGPGGGELGSPLGPGGGAPMAAPGGVAYASIAAQRAPLMDEVNKDPATKKLLMQMMATEGGGAATVESLFNRVSMIRQKVPGYSIKDELNSRFYGPLRRGDRPDISTTQAAGFQKTIDEVAAGSNLIQGRTNQGLPTDPGAGAPGRVQAPGSTDVYNYWSGERGGVGFGVEDSARFAQQQANMVANAKPQNTPGGGAAGDVVDQMVGLAGARGKDVREFLRDPSGKIKRDPDLGLWCAEFTNAYLQHAGVPGTGSLAARSFATWGQAVRDQDVQKGDVLLNRNLKHVGVATGQTRFNPATGQFEIQEVSSNSLGPGGQVLNIPGTRWRSDVEVRRSQELALAEARGANRTMVAQNGGAANGSVDVHVRHSNPPPGTTVMASATGVGVRVGDPQVSHQQFISP
jgi:hypothetical protein